MAGSRADELSKAKSGGGMSNNLFAAIEKNDVVGIKKALDKAGLINPNALLDSHNIAGKTAIFYAIQCRSVEALRTLLDYADTHKLLDKLLMQKDGSGYTPLMQIIWHLDGEENNLEMATLLLNSVKQKKGIMKDMLSTEDNSGKTAIMHAVSRDYASIVSLLLEYGSPLEKKKNVHDYRTIRGPVKNCEAILQQYIDTAQHEPLVSPRTRPISNVVTPVVPHTPVDPFAIDLSNSMDAPTINLLDPNSKPGITLLGIDESDIESLHPAKHRPDMKQKTSVSPTTISQMPSPPQSRAKSSGIPKPVSKTASETYRKSITGLKEGEEPPIKSSLNIPGGK